MGHFVNGEWKPGWYSSDAEGGFVRPPTTFRAQLDGSALQAGQYLLYVSLACPWAHRTLIARSLLGLAAQLEVAVVDWLLDDNGWAFRSDHPGATPDPLWNSAYLRELYLRADPAYTGRVTVPIVWDRAGATIVNNESREILRQLSTLRKQSYDLSPTELLPTIDSVLDQIYQPINNGVYRCGFASSQHAYDEAVGELFEGLDHWEQVLARQPFLAGNRFSEADICMFTTLVRFDAVYSVHFKCSRRRIVDYPNLSNYLSSCYQLPGVAETCNLDHIRGHYYASHRHINPTGIIAVCPDLRLEAAHDRWSRFPKAVYPKG